MRNKKNKGNAKKKKILKKITNLFFQSVDFRPKEIRNKGKTK